ncbi:hypothetical protein HYPBUDRAFT_3521 [Hyphopichia burtonii NRRL Y-1933]|uniref:Uncharacterized protein n=1 Tax=Hyphopichia burtonii NRRL Y-1933 TaxID=984485 RepID=A0A1E4RQR3_9ASCO|nr:hypothetical protein HYPBUDRAFT_3521 [Hyphopichia burtonii NRRL Y-1933]ODV69551.1 hypothetical protein HYPBUDRAFT_3521 [Hyphopichia burtonii NRRL Y-1933]
MTYTAVEGLMLLVNSLHNGAAPGTGVYPLILWARNLLGHDLPQVLIDYNVGVQNNLFGSYPTEADVAPSIVFTFAFLLLMFGHIIILSINLSRGHYFWLTPVWILHCIIKAIGWITRWVWAQDITKISVGLTSEILLIVSTYILVSFNLILAQRLFTWRHPVGGSRWLFWNVMIVLYSVVVVVVAITVLGSFVPYLDYLSRSAHDKWNQVVMATAVLIILYSLTSAALIALSYFFKPTTKDENLYTYQPWWIESFHPFYYVKKNAARDAEETFMKRNHNHRHAIRVIAATHHHYKMVKGLSNERGALKHNTSLLIIFLSTIFIFVGSIGRAIVVFQPKYNEHENPLCKPVVAYIFWGVLEVIIHLLYLLGRVDLRFYRPDILPLKVRSIITAEQSFYPSDDEMSDESSTISTTSTTEDLEKQQKQYNSYNNLAKPNPQPLSPPYPTNEYAHEKKMNQTKLDDEDEFFF